MTRPSSRGGTAGPCKTLALVGALSGVAHAPTAEAAVAVTSQLGPANGGFVLSIPPDGFLRKCAGQLMVSVSDHGVPVNSRVAVLKGVDSVMVWVRSVDTPPGTGDRVLTVTIRCGGRSVAVDVPKGEPKRADDVPPGWIESATIWAKGLQGPIRYAPRCEVEGPFRPRDRARLVASGRPLGVPGTPLLVCPADALDEPNVAAPVLYEIVVTTRIGRGPVERRVWVLRRSPRVFLPAIGLSSGPDGGLVPGPGSVDVAMTPFDLAGNRGETRHFSANVNWREAWSPRMWARLTEQWGTPSDSSPR